jgi:hypothetical protein
MPEEALLISAGQSGLEVVKELDFLHCPCLFQVRGMNLFRIFLNPKSMRDPLIAANCPNLNTINIEVKQTLSAFSQEQVPIIK